MPAVAIKENEERATLRALRESDLSSVRLDYADLLQCLGLIEKISTLEETKTILRRLLKTIALVYVELERRERVNRR